MKFLVKFGKSGNEIREMLCKFTGISPQLLFSVPEDKGNIERQAF